MPPFDLDLTDPTPAVLETAMCNAVKYKLTRIGREPTCIPADS